MLLGQALWIITTSISLPAREYLRSGCQEVWLLFPENQLVMIATGDRWQVFTQTETVATQIALSGFSISVAELFV